MMKQPTEVPNKLLSLVIRITDVKVIRLYLRNMNDCCELSFCSLLWKRVSENQLVSSKVWQPGGCTVQLQKAEERRRPNIRLLRRAPFVICPRSRNILLWRPVLSILQISETLQKRPHAVNELSMAPGILQPVGQRGLCSMETAWSLSAQPMEWGM